MFFIIKEVIDHGFIDPLMKCKISQIKIVNPTSLEKNRKTWDHVLP